MLVPHHDVISAVLPFRSVPGWLQQGLPAVVATPLKILLIVFIAAGARLAARKFINGAVSRMIDNPKRGPLSAVRRSEGSRGQARERRRQRAQAVGDVLRSAATIAITTVAFVMILGALDISVGPIIASAGIAGVALGFGAQSLVSDFLSGLLMLIEDQYGVGDWIEISGTSGTVEEVGLRVTKLRDLGGAVCYVRNGQILKLSNYSQDWARAMLDVPFASDQDVDGAMRTLEEAAWSLKHDPAWAKKVLDSPQVWGLTTLSREEITLRVSVNTSPPDRWDLERELRRRVKAALESDEAKSA